MPLHSYPFTPLFYSLLKLYHLFPIHAPITLILMDAPWGRFAYSEVKGKEYKKSIWDLDGNWAWCFMEIWSVSFRSLGAVLW